MSHHLDETSTDTTVVSRSPLDSYEDTNDYGYHETEPTARRGRTRGAAGSAVPADGEEAAREKFGGINWGASLLGWLLAVTVAGLLTGAAGGTAAALGTTPDLTRPGSGTGLVATAALLVLLMLGYYTGGYVAGRMSRFDGALQGFGVWVLGLVVMVAGAVLGVILDREHDLRSRVDLVRISDATAQVGWQVLVGVGLLVLAGTLLAAALGGSVGRRYHRRVDRVVHA